MAEVYIPCISYKNRILCRYFYHRSALEKMVRNNLANKLPSWTYVDKNAGHYYRVFVVNTHGRNTDMNLDTLINNISNTRFNRVVVKFGSKNFDWVSYIMEDDPLLQQLRERKPELFM